MKLIVALIDFAEVTSDLVTLAARLAEAMNSKLILLHVAMPDTDFVDGKMRDDVSRKGIARDLHHRHREMEILQMELKKLGIDAVALMVRSKSSRSYPVGKILAEMERLAPDLIVMGSRGRGWLHRLLAGSVTDAVVRKVSCSVLLVPTPRIRAGRDTQTR